MNNINAYDAASKRILSNKLILCNIMKQCIPEYKDLSKEEIMKCIEDGGDETHIKGLNVESFNYEGEEVKFDIFFTSKLPNCDEQIGMYIDIEPQNDMYLNYELLNRAIYYGARLIDRQKGEAFNNNDYDKIRKVYSIWICINPKSRQRDCVNYYSFDEECVKGNYHSEFDYKKINIIMLYVGKEYSLDSEGILEMLNLIFADTTHDESLKLEKLNNSYGIILDRKEVSNMTNLSRGFVQEGIEQGLILGQKNGIVQTIVSFINSGISIEEAFEITKADEEIKQEVIRILKNKGAVTK